MRTVQVGICEDSGERQPYIMIQEIKSLFFCKSLGIFHSKLWGITTLGTDHGKLIQVINYNYEIPSVASQVMDLKAGQEQNIIAGAVG